MQKNHSVTWNKCEDTNDITHATQFFIQHVFSSILPSHYINNEYNKGYIGHWHEPLTVQAIQNCLQGFVVPDLPYEHDQIVSWLKPSSFDHHEPIIYHPPVMESSSSYSSAALPFSFPQKIHDKSHKANVLNQMVEAKKQKQQDKKNKVTQQKPHKYHHHQQQHQHHKYQKKLPLQKQVQASLMVESNINHHNLNNNNNKNNDEQKNKSPLEEYADTQILTEMMNSTIEKTEIHFHMGNGIFPVYPVHLWNESWNLQNIAFVIHFKSFHHLVEF